MHLMFLPNVTARPQTSQCFCTSFACSFNLCLALCIKLTCFQPSLTRPHRCTLKGPGVFKPCFLRAPFVGFPSAIPNSLKSALPFCHYFGPHKIENLHRRRLHFPRKSSRNTFALHERCQMDPNGSKCFFQCQGRCVQPTPAIESFVSFLHSAWQ